MKIKLLAATAIISMVAVSTAAMAAPLSVSRQVLLDGGAVASGLRLTETISVNAVATTTGSCVLSWSTAADPASTLQASAAAATDVTTVTDTATMTASRVNPHGMAIGQAIYNGDWTPSAPSGASAALQASCPGGNTYQVELTPYIPPQLIKEAQQGAVLTEATITTTEDTVCRDARKAFVDAHNAIPGNKNDNMGYAYGQHCPDIVTSVAATYGPDIPAEYSEAVPATYATYAYTYSVQNVHTAFSNGSGVLDNITFNFGF